MYRRINTITENYDEDNNKIPNIIWQTYNKLYKIPEKVYKNIEKFAPNYKHNIYNNFDCIEFIKQHFGYEVLDAFNTLKTPAHKADLWRYCVLYIHGGVYLDIKTVLIQNIDTVFTNRRDMYSVIGNFPNSIYQGVLASPPKNKIFLDLIQHIVKNRYTRSYDKFINYLYKIISKKTITNKVSFGINMIKNNEYPNIYLFQENCTSKKGDCYDGLDRYKLCCYIYNSEKKFTKENRVIKVRYSDYPWK